MVTYRFEHVSVQVDDCSRTVVSEFADGTVLAAAPQYDDESVARAASLGYPDVWAMTADHDLCHHLVAMAQGLPYSEHLHRIATHQPSPDGDAEERVVLMMQRLANRGLASLVNDYHTPISVRLAVPGPAQITV